MLWIGEPEKPKPASCTLVWEAPPGCPSADEIRKRIHTLVPDPEDGEGVMQVEGTVTISPTGFSLELATEFGGERSTRRIEATLCEPLAESTALVAAIALEPTLGEPDPPTTVPAPPSPQPRSAPVAMPEVVVARPAIAPTARSRRRKRRGPIDLVTRAAVGLEFGSAPRVGGSSSLALAVVWPRLRLEVAGAYRWPSRLDGPDDTAARYQLGVVGARGCGRLFAGIVEFPVCLGFDVGALRVDSRGLTPPRTVHATWLGPLGGAGMAVRRRRVGFWTMAELAATAMGSRILVGDAVAWRTIPVSVRLLAGLEIFFALPTITTG